MLRVKVELVPFGDESLSKQIGEMVVANDGTGTPAVGSYVAWLEADSHSNTPRTFIKIDGFDRRKSVWKLLEMLLVESRLSHLYGPSDDPKSVDRRVEKHLGHVDSRTHIIPKKKKRKKSTRLGKALIGALTEAVDKKY